MLQRWRLELVLRTGQTIIETYRANTAEAAQQCARFKHGHKLLRIGKVAANG